MALPARGEIWTAICCVARERLTRRLGQVDQTTMQAVNQRLRVLLEL